MKIKYFILFILCASLQCFGDVMDELAGVRSALATLYTDYYSSQKILITYKQKINEENVPIYFSKLFNLPLDVAHKRYPYENYDLTVELAYCNNIIFWKHAPNANPLNYEAILIDGDDDIYYNSNGKYAIVNYLNYNTESRIPKITDYLCKIPEFSSADLPYSWKPYSKLIQDALNGKGKFKVLSKSNDEIVFELSIPFQRKLQYLIIVELKKINGVFMPKRYYHKSSHDANAISLWKVECKYDSKSYEIIFPSEIVVNYYHYLNDSTCIDIKTDVFSDITVKKITLGKNEVFRPLTLPEGTLLRFGEKDQTGVMIGDVLEHLKKKIKN